MPISCNSSLDLIVATFFFHICNPKNLTVSRLERENHLTLVYLDIKYWSKGFHLVVFDHFVFIELTQSQYMIFIQHKEAIVFYYLSYCNHLSRGHIITRVKVIHIKNIEKYQLSPW